MNLQENINLEVLLHPELVGKDLTVHYISPDFAGIQELDYAVIDHGIRFQIPRLDFYGVVSIRARE